MASALDTTWDHKRLSQTLDWRYKVSLGQKYYLNLISFRVLILC